MLGSMSKGIMLSKIEDIHSQLYKSVGEGNRCLVLTVVEKWAGEVNMETHRERKAYRGTVMC